MTTLLQTDAVHLARAIELAEGGRGRTTPNPLVGAVVVKDGEVLGEGFHTAYGAPHAEREALAACGEPTRAGATMYVSLEPCCHQGQTPPCTEAILEAGISRVVIASDDPTEKASGRGLGILRDEGVEVVVADGELAARARLLNQPFRKHARTGRPLVLFKSAMTLDGKVATRTGDSKWISGEDSRACAHRWRAECDAVAVGIGTALADDPQLTARVDGVDAPAAPGRLRLRGAPAAGLRARRGAAEVPLTVVVSRAAPRARHRRARVGGRRRDRGDRRERARARALRARPARRAGHHLDPARGRPAPGRRVPRRRRDRRDPAVPRARCVLGGCAAPATRSRARASSGSPRRCARSRSTCERVGDDVLIAARLREW